MTGVANHILHIVQSQSAQNVAMVTGYVLLARFIDTEGRMHTHAQKPHGQELSVTEEILTKDAPRLLAQD